MAKKKLVDGRWLLVVAGIVLFWAAFQYELPFDNNFFLIGGMLMMFAGLYLSKNKK